MQLLHLFTVAGATNDTLHTSWVPFPQDYDRCEFWVDCKMFDGSTITVALESGMDTDEDSAQTAATSNFTAVNTDVTDVTTKLGAYVRLKFTISASAGRGVFSVWVLPKRS